MNYPFGFFIRNVTRLGKKLYDISDYYYKPFMGTSTLPGITNIKMNKLNNVAEDLTLDTQTRIAAYLK